MLHTSVRGPWYESQLVPLIVAAGDLIQTHVLIEEGREGGAVKYILYMCMQLLKCIAQTFLKSGTGLILSIINDQLLIINLLLIIISLI